MSTYDFLTSPGDISAALATRVRLRRKENKLTQARLAERSGVSLGSLKRFEQSGEISLSSLIKIAFVLGAERDFDELFVKHAYASIQEVAHEKR